MRKPKQSPLPTWLAEELEKDYERLKSSLTHPEGILIYKNKKNSSYSNSLTPEIEYPDMDKAYNALSPEDATSAVYDTRKTLKKDIAKLGRGTFFAPSHLEKHGVVDVMYFQPYLPLNVEYARQELAETYHQWVTSTNPRYKAKPKSWARAYDWVDQHPMFWTKYESLGGKLYGWETNLIGDGRRSIEIVPDRDRKYRAKKRGAYFFMELGPHIPSESYQSLYVDPALARIKSRNYKDYFIKVAAKIAELYPDDGFEQK